MNMRALTGTDDLPRRTFTVKEVERMSEIGLIREDERVELLGGELVPMQAKGGRHEAIKLALLWKWYRAAPETVSLIPETTFRLDVDTFLEPDILVFPRGTRLEHIDPASVLLAVEIASSSRLYDLGPKALVYAHYGVRELWVIDAISMTLHVHREPEGGRYRSITPWPAEERVEPRFAPIEFALRLGDLDLTE
ncbi:MAG: Uma2 family endonuclease [Bosea sp.]|nr:Uma2 family endonuclease [Bosea sp. (in: a-proteobacteria)]